MSSDIDIEAQQVIKDSPHAGAFFSHEKQPVVSRAVAETPDMTSTASCCCIPSGVLHPFTSVRYGSNVDHSQRNVINNATGGQPTQAGQGSSQAKAQPGMYFLAIVEISMA